MFKYFMCFIILFSFNSLAQEFADSFILEVFDTHVKVISPKKKANNPTVVVLNKTLTKIYGKLATSKKDVKFISIAPKKTKSIQVSSDKNEKLMFIPFAPTFQEIDLVFGRSAYEIPEQI